MTIADCLAGLSARAGFHC